MKNGVEQLHVVYPKFKNGEAVVRNVKVQQNFGKYTAFSSHYNTLYRVERSIFVQVRGAHSLLTIYLALL